MLDPQLQERFARRCTDAAFGYTAATSAAYAAFTDQMLSFWAGALKPQDRVPAPFEAAWNWAAPARKDLACVPFLPIAWATPQRPAVPTGYPFAGGTYDVFSAWSNMFQFAVAPTVWPMAFFMMASGVPRSVAWPTAEANAAVMDAADAAAVSVQQAFASYRTEGGHSVSRQIWPPAQLMMLAAMMPLGFGAILSSMRMA